MESDQDRGQERLSYLSGCMAYSPSWFPLHREASRFHMLGRDNSTCLDLSRSRSRSCWRNLIKRLVIKEGWRRSLMIYNSNKPITFGYDAVSYSKNFDDGCRNEGPSRSMEDSGQWQLKAAH